MIILLQLAQLMFVSVGPITDIAGSTRNFFFLTRLLLLYAETTRNVESALDDPEGMILRKDM